MERNRYGDARDARDGKDVSLGQSPISPCALLLPVAFFGKRFINVAGINKQTDA